MKKILFLIAVMAACMPSLAQVQITEAQALQVVKNYRMLKTDTANFYIGEVDRLLNESYCPFDSSALNLNTWLLNQDKM